MSNCRILSHFGRYCQLIRLDKPIGSLLLLWPTLGALWLASKGVPSWRYIIIFTLGTVLMRSAGCAINDYMDRDIDAYVQRTEKRVLAVGLITPKEALMVTVVLLSISFLLVLFLNRLTIGLSVLAACIAGIYPLFKRFFPIPQAWLGIAYGFGIPMAYAAVLDTVPWVAWVLLVANIFWTIAYDTEYAMVDREDDLKLGLQTSAITFGRLDTIAILVCYILALALFLWVGWYVKIGIWSLIGWVCAIGCVLYHWYLIRHRDRAKCFKAFRHNNWLGFSLFAGIVFEYALG